MHYMKSPIDLNEESSMEELGTERAPLIDSNISGRGNTNKKSSVQKVKSSRKNAIDHEKIKITLSPGSSDKNIK